MPPGEARAVPLYPQPASPTQLAFLTWASEAGRGWRALADRPKTATWNSATIRACVLRGWIHQPRPKLDVHPAKPDRRWRRPQPDQIGVWTAVRLTEAGWRVVGRVPPAGAPLDELPKTWREGVIQDARRDEYAEADQAQD